jgi:hypothetical protein
VSEFVECQNCGRRFFAENLECPYCAGTQDVDDLIEEITGQPQKKPLVFQRFRWLTLLVLLAFALLFLIPLLRR